MGKNWIKKIRTIAAALIWSLFLAAVGVGAGAFNREKKQASQVVQIEKPKVALTFDDGPNKKYTPVLLVTMFPVLWDVDTLDWKSKNVDCIMSLVRSQVKDGSIILMHDGYQTSVDAAVQIMDELLERGYEFVTVDQLLVL